MLSGVSCPNFRSGGRATRTQAQFKFSAPHLRTIALQGLTSVSLYAVGSLLSQVLLGVDGRRTFKRNSMFPRRTCGELLCKASLGSPYILSVLFCLNFRSGWTGAAHSSATQCFRVAPAGNCFAKPPLNLPICCQFSPVSMSARSGRAPRIQAQLNVSALRQRRIALENLPWISLYAVSALLFQFPLGVDGRRAFKRNSMLPRRTCGELLYKTSL